MSKDKIKSFEDLKVWRDAHAFTVLVYKATEKFPIFFGFSIVCLELLTNLTIVRNVNISF